jgi:hypothetical protein
MQEMQEAQEMHDEALFFIFKVRLTARLQPVPGWITSAIFKNLRKYRERMAGLIAVSAQACAFIVIERRPSILLARLLAPVLIP